jgi:hypothetical protein
MVCQATKWLKTNKAPIMLEHNGNFLSPLSSSPQPDQPLGPERAALASSNTPALEQAIDRIATLESLAGDKNGLCFGSEHGLAGLFEKWQRTE